MSTLRIAIDGNEANVSNRVGSNVFAYELLKSMEEQTRTSSDHSFVVLLRELPHSDMPETREGWQYKVIGPSFLWTQISLPIHLYLHQIEYDVFFTPGHYAPRLSVVPYVSSVMDLAFLKFPEQFEKSDFIQLKDWTKYSVKHAKKVIAISETTKQDIIKTYKKSAADIEVIYPAVEPLSYVYGKNEKQFFAKHGVRVPYFLFVGTFQPRKNLIRLVEAFEEVCRELHNVKGKKKQPLPQLVLAGKIGWLADETVERIKSSPFYQYIILPGFIEDSLKPALYSNAAASVLVGLYEGFGLPPLESLHYGTVPIVSNNSSLPEVVGEAGFLVDPTDVIHIAEAMKYALSLKAKQKAQLRKKAREQVKKFSWQESAAKVLKILESVANSK